MSAAYDVVEIVAVGASPSCGVSTPLDLDHAVHAIACCEPSSLDQLTVNQSVVALASSPGKACSSQFSNANSTDEAYTSSSANTT
jgi:hypothetical protein